MKCSKCSKFMNRFQYTDYSREELVKIGNLWFCASCNHLVDEGVNEGVNAHILHHLYGVITYETA